MKLPAYLGLLLTTLLVTACVEEADELPAFVSVDAFELVTGQGEGAATSDIREVWAFVGGNFLGAYDLPARIPLYESGTTEVELRAGVHKDGRSVTPEPYEFYAPVVRTLDLEPGMTTALGTLPLRYADGIRFGFIEDFEDGEAEVFTVEAVGEAPILAQGQIVRSGNFAGTYSLTDSIPLVEFQSEQVFRELLRTRQYVYLELDYRSDVPTQTGVVPVNGPVGVTPLFDAGFRGRDTWTKLYIDLTPVIGQLESQRATDYRVGLTSLILEEGQTSGTVYLDNLKLLYFD